MFGLGKLLAIEQCSYFFQSALGMSDSEETKSQDLALLFHRANRILGTAKGGTSQYEGRAFVRKTGGGQKTNTSKAGLRPKNASASKKGKPSILKQSFFQTVSLSSDEDCESNELPAKALVEDTEGEHVASERANAETLQSIAETFQAEISDEHASHEEHDTGPGTNGDSQARKAATSVAYPFLSPSSEFQLFDQSMVRTITRTSQRKLRQGRTEKPVQLGLSQTEIRPKKAAKGHRQARGEKSRKKPTLSKGRTSKKSSLEQHANDAELDLSSDAQIFHFPSDLPGLHLGDSAASGAGSHAPEVFNTHDESSPELYVPVANNAEKDNDSGRKEEAASATKGKLPHSKHRQGQPVKTKPRETGAKKQSARTHTGSRSANTKPEDLGAEKSEVPLIEIEFRDSTADRPELSNLTSPSATKSTALVPSASSGNDASSNKQPVRGKRNMADLFLFSDSDSDEVPCGGTVRALPASDLLYVPGTCNDDSLSSSHNSTSSKSTVIDELSERLNRILSQKETKSKRKTRLKRKPKASTTDGALEMRKAMFMRPMNEGSEGLDLSGLYRELRVPSQVQHVVDHSCTIPDTQPKFEAVTAIPESPEFSCTAASETLRGSDGSRHRYPRLYPELSQGSEGELSPSIIAPTDIGVSDTAVIPGRFYPPLPSISDYEKCEAFAKHGSAGSSIPCDFQPIANSTKCSPPADADTPGDDSSVTGTPAAQAWNQDAFTLPGGMASGASNFSLQLSVSAIQSPPRSRAPDSSASVDVKMKVKATEPCKSTCHVVLSPGDVGSPDVCKASVQLTVPTCVTPSCTRPQMPGQHSSRNSARKAAFLHASVHSPLGQSPHGVSLHMSLESGTPDFCENEATSLTSPEMRDVSLQVSIPGNSANSSLQSIESTPSQRDKSAQVSITPSDIESHAETSGVSQDWSSRNEPSKLLDDSTVDRTGPELANHADVGSSFVSRATKESLDGNSYSFNSSICYQKMDASINRSPRKNLFGVKAPRPSITFTNTEAYLEYTPEHNRARAWRRESSLSVADMSFRTAGCGNYPSDGESESDGECEKSIMSSSGSSNNSAFRTCQESDFSPLDLEDSPVGGIEIERRCGTLHREGKKMPSVEAAPKANKDGDGFLSDINSPSDRAVSAQKHCTEFLSSEDDDDEQLENFFKKMATPATRGRSSEGRLTLEEFIVSDSDCSDLEEDSMFYINAPNPDRAEDKENDCHGAVLSSPSSSDDFTQPAPFKTPARTIVKPCSWTTKPGSRPVRSPPNRANAMDTIATPARAPLRSLGRQHNHSNSPLQYGFLKSLSLATSDGSRDPEAVKYVKSFKKHREDLCAHLFKLYNRTVFDDQLPADLKISWNSRLLKTAGYCTYRKLKASGTRTASIDLSSKVCDCAERVRDTLIHELCHAAVWLLHGLNGGHGVHWKFWAQKATKIHCELPNISRCHSYSINYKYEYKCTSCGYALGRHSKSLDTAKKICGYCSSPFQLLVNTPQGPVAARTPTTKTPNKFALFVKENYGKVKSRGLAHKDVMNALSADFAALNKIQ